MYKLIAPRVEGTVEVRGGRHLAFADFGVPSGRTFLWLHGTPGARRQIPQDARVMAEELGLRIIGVDRPATGLSTPHLYSSILDFVPDLQILLEKLNVDRFGVIGLSGGGPYALATAYAMPERVVVAGILGGVAPFVGEDHISGGLVGALARLRPALPLLRMPLSKLLQGLVVVAKPFGNQAIGIYSHFAAEGDKVVLSRPDVKAMFLDDLTRDTRHGIGAPMNDLTLFLRDWGFTLEEVKVPVRWWHGDADNIVPLVHGQHCVSRLPDARLFLRPGESHLGGLGAATEVLEALLKFWV